MSVKYIIGHWTGGNYIPNKTCDLRSYQLLIGDGGELYQGLPVGAAASIGGMNSITYNIACCGGLLSTPIKKVQIEAFYKACAEKIKEYSLSVSDFYTHAEIGEMVQDGSISRLLSYNSYLEQNKTKIDLTKIPGCSGSPSKVGDYIRKKIKWYCENYY